MRNVRHLWTSVRPNGDDRPHGLNRLEIRICDLIDDPLLLLAVTAFTELRLQRLLRDPHGLDPLAASRFGAAELEAIADANDRAAARSSLEAQLTHWRSGQTVVARDWIAAELEAMASLAAELGLERWLAPLHGLLATGNQAMRWLARQGSGESISAIIGSEAVALESREKALDAWLETEAAQVPGGS
jgi:predicted glutamate--cysteine ligase